MCTIHSMKIQDSYGATEPPPAPSPPLPNFPGEVFGFVCPPNLLVFLSRWFLSRLLLSISKGAEEVAAPIERRMTAKETEFTQPGVCADVTGRLRGS